jgi:hypothetical protein
MPRTKKSEQSSMTTLEEIPFIMVQKLGDYILYVMSTKGLDAATIRASLEQGPSDRNPGGGLIYKMDHYLNVLTQGKRILPGNASEIRRLWLQFCAKLSNANVSLDDKDLIQALRMFQLSTCVEDNYIRLPKTYSLCQFWTDSREVRIPIASLKEIEDRHGVPDYGTGIQGTVQDGVYYAQQAANKETPSPSPSSQ